MDLIEASQQGNLYIVKELVKKGANVNLQNNYGDTALMHALWQGHLDIVRYLINNYACAEHVNLRNNYGNTALMLASWNGYLDIVKKLIIKGADACTEHVNLQNNYGKSALMWASRKGYLKIVKYLIKNGANVNLQDDVGYTALICASKNDNLDIVKYLIRKGADACAEHVNLQNNNGNTVLMYDRNKTTKETILREVKLRNVILRERIMNVAHQWNMHMPLELKHVIIKKFIN